MHLHTNNGRRYVHEKKMCGGDEIRRIEYEEKIATNRSVSVARSDRPYARIGE